MSVVVTRMQDLAYEFSQTFRGRGRPPPAPTPSQAGRKRPGVGAQTLVPLSFSAVVAPMNKGVNNLLVTQTGIVYSNTTVRIGDRSHQACESRAVSAAPSVEIRYLHVHYNARKSTLNRIRPPRLTE